MKGKQKATNNKTAKKQLTIYQTHKKQSRPTSLRFAALEIDNMCRCASLHCQASECCCMLHFAVFDLSCCVLQVVLSKKIRV